MEYMYTFPLSFLKYWKHTVDTQLNLQRLLEHFGFHVGLRRGHRWHGEIEENLILTQVILRGNEKKG